MILNNRDLILTIKEANLLSQPFLKKLVDKIRLPRISHYILNSEIINTPTNMSFSALNIVPDPDYSGALKTFDLSIVKKPWPSGTQELI